MSLSRIAGFAFVSFGVKDWVNRRGDTLAHLIWGVAEIVSVEANSDLYRSVLQLYRQNKATLGVIPKGAFLERARDGTLLAAVSDDELAGYLLYSLPSQHISLAHLCVASTARGKGIAARLVAELEQLHPERRGIRLRCRRDWLANSLWEVLDFMPIVEGPGRSKAGHLLTSWWKDFGHPDLFSYDPFSSTRVLAAVDTDVFLDLVDGRREAGEESRLALLNAFVVDEIDIGLTQEVSAEINHNTDPAVRKMRFAQTGDFTRITARSDKWRRNEGLLLEQLAGPLNAHQRADIRHIARAAAGGARFFLTRDDEVLAKLRNHALELFDIKVMRPLEIAHQYAERDDSYMPAAVQGTHYVRRPAGPDEHRNLASRFFAGGTGDNSAAFRHHLRSLMAEPNRWRTELVDNDRGEPVALLVSGICDGALHVPLFRFIGPNLRAISRSSAFELKQRAMDQQLTQICVTDAHVPPAVARSLTEESYVYTDAQWVAILIVGLRRFEDLPESIRVAASSGTTPLSAVEAADVERRHWPVKLVDSEMPTYIMPIRPHWAAALFDTEIADGTLFRRPEGLGLAREHVYYRTPKGGLKVPARILWYVSAGAPGAMAIRATSVLNETSIDRPLTLHRRHRRLGVYTERDVEGAARQGQAMALRFSDTEVFETPVTLKRLRELSALHCLTPFVRSDWAIPSALFADIYREGSQYRGT